jgi:PAS domain S-box-containing protein
VLGPASDAILMIDGAGRIRAINGEAERAFGYGRGELLGRPVEILITERTGKQHPELWKSFFGTLRSRPMETRYELAARRKDGTEFPVDIVLNPIETEDQSMVFATVRDVAVRRGEMAQAGYLAALIESSNDPMISKDLTGTITTWNPAAESLLGYTADEIIGKHISSLLPPDRLDEEDLILERIRRGEKLEHFETFRCGKDGREIAVSLTISPVRDSTGEIIGASKIVRDITDSMQSHRQIVREHDTAQRYLEMAGVMILALDVVGSVTLINRRGCQILGYKDSKEIVGKSWIDSFVPERMRDAVRDVFERLVRGEEASVEFYTNPVITRTGEERIIAWHNSLVTDEEGHVTTSLSSGEDITERMRIEAALRDRESLLTNAQRVAALGIWELDLAQNHLTWSDQTYRIFGIAPEDFGHTFEAFLERIHPVDAERLKPLYAHPPSDGSPVECEYRIVRPDGQERIVYERGEVVFDDNDQPRRKLGVVWDITDLKQSEQALRQSEARFRELAENIQEVFWLSTVEKDKILYVSPAFEFIWGHPCDALYRSPLVWLDAIHPEDRPRVLEAARTRQATSEYNEEYRIVRPDGSIRWISDRAFPIRDESGRTYRIAGVAQDITERKLAESQFLQAQKLEAIGLLTGGIAHDFNNLLAIIHGNLELIKDGSTGDAESDEMIDDALGAAARGASLTYQLLAYSRQQPLVPKVVNLDQLVAQVTRLLHRTLGETIEIKTVMPPDLWTTKIDPNQLENALLNLAVNARDAMQDGGKLTIECANEILDESYAEQNPEVTPGPYVLLTVTDNGTGIPKDIIERVLEPFFTTKSVGAGSGLGLSMVFGFVKQSGGHIKIYSEVGRGTTVSLYLPKASTGEGSREAASDTGAIPRSIDGEVIFVLEDDEKVRRFAVRALGGLGYRTIQAADGPDALRLLNDAGRIDLLLTDVSLPRGMNGPAVAREARAKRSGLKVLYMSGYAQDAIINNGILGEGMHLLTKPFPKAELARKVREILDEGG